MLLSKCKRLYDFGEISNFYNSSGTIKVKISGNKNPISITLTKDLESISLRLIYYQSRNGHAFFIKHILTCTNYEKSCFLL